MNDDTHGNVAAGEDPVPLSVDQSAGSSDFSAMLDGDQRVPRAFDHPLISMESGVAVAYTSVEVSPHVARVRPARVWAVIPCYNRPDDLAHLIADLKSLSVDEIHETTDEAGNDAGKAIRLSLLIVDNASSEPIEPQLEQLGTSTLGVPLEVLRLERNFGGSGGFNAGMRLVLERLVSEAASTSSTCSVDLGESFVWLLDSDARVRADTLVELVRAMRRREDAAAIGSSVADPVTGCVFEVGGCVDRRTGRYRHVLRGVAGAPEEVECEYSAACSVLVRADAIVRTGLMPDVFLNGDDVEWFIRMRRATGQHILASSRSIAMHPRFDRFALGARYYVARNALNPIRAIGLPRRVLFRRAMHEVGRAISCDLSGRHDLSLLHLNGLRDSLAGARTGAVSRDRLRFDAFEPLETLAMRLIEMGALKGANDAVSIISMNASATDGLAPSDLETLTEQVRSVLAHVGGNHRGVSNVGSLDIVEASQSGRKAKSKAIGRFAGVKRPHIAIVPAKPSSDALFAGRWIVQLVPGVVGGRAGFVIRASSAREQCLGAMRATKTLGAGAGLAVRLARHRAPLLTLDDVLSAPISAERSIASVRIPTLSIIVLSYNRREKLTATLGRLEVMSDTRDAEIIVIDNGSSDGSAAAAASACSRAKVIAIEENTGVAALNMGVEAASGDVVLVLDDDAWPDDGVVAAAVSLMARRQDIDAVALHPHHPATRQSEWPFARRALGESGVCDERWPVMGCGNIVRRSVWRGVGGYEPEFFLYRNDVDLALKVLARASAARGSISCDTTTRGVYFNPAWIVWHDSPAAEAKSERWHFLATRNWIWTARRHGRGPNGAVGLLLGWLWAHRLARFSIWKHVQTWRGAIAGMMSSPPLVPDAVHPTGRDFAKLLRLHLSRFTRR